MHNDDPAVGFKIDVEVVGDLVLNFIVQSVCSIALGLAGGIFASFILKKITGLQEHPAF